MAEFLKTLLLMCVLGSALAVLLTLLRPLIAETTATAPAAARPAAVQTGPAVRGDLPTQERHLRLLADDALLSDIYRLITQSIWETSRKIS